MIKEKNKEINELENNIKKLEKDLRYHIKNEFVLKIQKDSSDVKIRSLMEVEEEYEELKEKVRYEPLEKLPDYLTEMRLKNTQIIENKSQNKKRNNNNNWDKILKNEKGNIFENVEKAKKKVEQLEEKAKMSEKLLENSNEGIDPELQQKVSGYLLDAIKGKLSILENMNQS